MLHPRRWPQVLHTRTLTYLPPNGMAASRPLTAWRTGPSHVTALVTEIGDGASIATAVEQVHSALRQLWPADAIRHLEYWPKASGCGPDHVDEAHRIPAGRWAWRRLSLAPLLAEFGPSLHTATSLLDFDRSES